MNIVSSNITEISTPKIIYTAENYNTDFMLPDYYGNISKILCCSIVPGVESHSVSDSKIIINGELQINLMYISEEKNLQCYNNTVKYMRTVSAESNISNSCISVVQEISSENVRALGPKRFNINGIVEIKILIESLNKLGYTQDIDDKDIQIKRKDLAYFNVTHHSDHTLKIKEHINTSCNISEIIHKDFEFDVHDKKTIKDKTYLSGKSRFTFTYLDNTGAIKKYSTEIPFNEIIETTFSEEGNECFIGRVSPNLNINLIKNENDNTTIEINADICFSVTCGSDNNISLIDDLYSIGSELETKQKDVNIISQIKSNSQICKITYIPENVNDAQLCEAYIKDIKITFEDKDNSVNLILDCKCCLISEYDNLYYYDEKKQIGVYKIDISRSNCRHEATSVKVLSIKPLQEKNYATGVVFEILVEYIEIESCNVILFTEIERTCSENTEADSKFFLYFAQPDESIWLIAKENKTTTEELCNINGIDSDTITSETMLVFPGF